MMGLRKVIAFMFCLCCLHNFCLTYQTNKKENVRPLASDSLEILAHGGIGLEEMTTGPKPLLHGGDHPDDTSRTFCQQFHCVSRGTCQRDCIVRSMAKNGLERPSQKPDLKLVCRSAIHSPFSFATQGP
jgi:hypothetical protein